VKLGKKVWVRKKRMKTTTKRRKWPYLLEGGDKPGTRGDHSANHQGAPPPNRGNITQCRRSFRDMSVL
jgi:hypothetical protein